jgi:hypothetical protein
MVQADALDQSRFVTGKDCRASDISAKGFAFPLKISFATVNRFVGKRERFIHAAGVGGEKRSNCIRADARPIQNGSFVTTLPVVVRAH